MSGNQTSTPLSLTVTLSVVEGYISSSERELALNENQETPPYKTPFFRSNKLYFFTFSTFIS